MRPPKKIDEIWVWVVTEADGSEGVPAASGIIEGHVVPMLGADEARIRGLEPWARAIAEAAGGLPLRLMRFRNGETVETVN
jgi:hypothetical protein